MRKVHGTSPRVPIFDIVAIHMNGLSVVQVAVEGFDKNFSYIIVDEGTKRAAIVDPCGEIDRVFDEMDRLALTLTMVVITHTHFDHHEKLDVILSQYYVPIYMHTRALDRTSATGERVKLVDHDDDIVLGESTIKVYYTPGHFDDCICLYIPKETSADRVPKLITGDTLFVEGCGRTTSSGVSALYNSLQFLKTFPDETEIFTGHDYGPAPVSTIGREKQHNKYFLAENFEAFHSIRLPNS